MHARYALSNKTKVAFQSMPSCPKLTTPLVNEKFNFQIFNMLTHCYFAEKNVWSFSSTNFSYTLDLHTRVLKDSINPSLTTLLSSRFFKQLGTELYLIQSNINASNTFGTMKFFRGRGTSSH